VTPRSRHRGVEVAISSCRAKQGRGGHARPPAGRRAATPSGLSTTVQCSRAHRRWSCGPPGAAATPSSLSHASCQEVAQTVQSQREVTPPASAASEQRRSLPPRRCRLMPTSLRLVRVAGGDWWGGGVRTVRMRRGPGHSQCSANLPLPQCGVRTRAWKSWDQAARGMRSASACDVIFSPPPNTVKSWGTDSTPGRTSRAFPPPHKRNDPGPRAPSCSLILSTGNKLTTPACGPERRVRYVPSESLRSAGRSRMHVDEAGRRSPPV
jgi:hypothetical protein